MPVKHRILVLVAFKLPFNVPKILAVVVQTVARTLYCNTSQTNVRWILIWYYKEATNPSRWQYICNLTPEKPNCFTWSVHWSAVLTKTRTFSRHFTD